MLHQNKRLSVAPKELIISHRDTLLLSCCNLLHTVCQPTKMNTQIPTIGFCSITVALTPWHCWRCERCDAVEYPFFVYGDEHRWVWFENVPVQRAFRINTYHSFFGATVIHRRHSHAVETTTMGTRVAHHWLNHYDCCLGYSKRVGNSHLHEDMIWCMACFCLQQVDIDFS